MRKSRSTIVICTIILLVGFSYYLSYYKYYHLSADEGHLVNSVMRVLDGQLPLKDFYQAYAPGRYWLLALLFRLFDPSLALERFVWVIVHALANVLMYLAAKRNMPPLFAAIPVLTMMILPGTWNKSLTGFLLLLNILMIYRYVGRFDRASLALCGLVVGLTVWFRQDIAGYVALTVLTCVFMHSILYLRSKRGRALARIRTKMQGVFGDLVVFSLVVALCLLPLVLLYWLRSGLYDLVRGITIGRFRSVLAVSKPFPSPLLILSAVPTTPPRTRILFLYVVTLMFAVLAFRVLFQAMRMIRKGETTYNWILFSTLLLAILYFMGHTFPWPGLFRLAQDGSLIYILGGYITYRLYSDVGDFIAYRTKRRRIGSMVGIMLTLILLVFPGYYVRYSLFELPSMGGGIPLASLSYLPIDSPRARIYGPKEQAMNLNDTINYIVAHTRPQDTIFAFNTPQLYFLADRKNATRQDKLTPSLAESWAAEQLIDDFRKNNPSLIIVSPREAKRYLTRLPTLRDVIAQNYEFDRMIGTYYIFRTGTTLSSPYSSMGLIYHILGKEQEAVAEYQKAVAIDAQDQVACRHLAEYRLGLGDGYLADGKGQEAVEEYQRALALKPELDEVAQFHRALGDAYLASDKPQEAAQEYERALALKPEFAEMAWFHLQLGKAYRQTGRREEAIAEYERVLELKPENAAARRALDALGE